MEPNSEITLKELFERMIKLETKFDEKTKSDNLVSKRFTYWAITISVLEIINLWVHSLSVWGH